jgi:GntR family transcriptional repressor for pyruvate dehydrogenase complex
MYGGQTTYAWSGNAGREESEVAGKETRLRPLAKEPLFERVAAALTDYIETHGLQPGDKLMSERELANQLGVARSSVREAVATLRTRGVVEARHGEGIFLRARPSLEEAITFQVHIPDLDLPYIWESRQALETQCARLAAARATPDDLAAMAHGIDVQTLEVRRGLPGTEGDRLFHEAVATASHNPMLQQFLTAMRDSLARTSSKSLGAAGQPERSLADHTAIYEAIRSHESNDAANAMLVHLVSTTDLLLGMDVSRHSGSI